MTVYIMRMHVCTTLIKQLEKYYVTILEKGGLAQAEYIMSYLQQCIFKDIQGH